MRIGFLQRYEELRIEFAKKTGFKSVELLVGPESDCLPGKDGWEDKAEAVKARFEEAGIRISCIGGLYVNHFDSQQAKEYEEFTRKVILLAERIEVPVVAGFAGKLIDRPLEESVEPFKKVWGKHAKFAEDHGVKIAFENCPMGIYHLPPGGNNCMCTPRMWELCFNAVPSDALGLEWDPSHLICLLIDPVENIRTWANKVYHVHAKDAKINETALRKYGIYAPGVIEHCFPGFGDTNWAIVIKELLRSGYRGDLNIEGGHDSVYNSRLAAEGRPEGIKLNYDGEDLGLMLSYRYLSQFVDEP